MKGRDRSLSFASLVDGRHLLPTLESTVPEESMVARAKKVSPHSKQVLDGCVDAQESLGLSYGLESSHLAFSLSSGLVSSLGPVVIVLPGCVGNRWNQSSMSGTVASQLVGDKLGGSRSLGFQELTKEPLGGLPISSLLQQNVDRVSVLVDGSPEVVSNPTDRDEEFIEMPNIPKSTLFFPQSSCVDRPELATPVPTRTRTTR